VPVLREGLGHPIPVAAVVAAAVHQQERRRAGIAPVDVVEAQPLREVDAGRGSWRCGERHCAEAPAWLIFCTCEGSALRSVAEVRRCYAEGTLARQLPMAPGTADDAQTLLEGRRHVGTEDLLGGLSLRQGALRGDHRS